MEENITLYVNKGLRSKVSFIIPSIGIAISLYITVALFYHKYTSSPSISNVGRKMNALNLFNSCLVFSNAVTILMYPILIEIVKSNEFCQGYFSSQIAVVFVSRYLTYVLFWIRQHHFYKKLHLKFKCLTIFQKICNIPLIIIAAFLAIIEYYLLYNYSTFYVYFNPAGMWGCKYEKFLKEVKISTLFIYSFLTFLYIALIFLVLIPILIKKRNKRKLNLSQIASNIEKTIPRLSASIFVSCLCNLVFIVVAVLVQFSYVEAYMDKTLLVALILNTNMIANLISLQFSFTDYKRRLFFQKKIASNSTLRLQQRKTIKSCISKEKYVLDISSGKKCDLIVRNKAMTTKI